MELKPEFVVSYRGEVTYRVNSKEYRVRYFAEDDGHYNGDYFQVGIAPAVGTVTCDNCNDLEEYPPAEVLALFPGYVGARWQFAKDAFGNILHDRPHKFETQSPPVLGVYPGWPIGRIWAKAYVDECLERDKHNEVGQT